MEGRRPLPRCGRAPAGMLSLRKFGISAERVETLAPLLSLHRLGRRCVRRAECEDSFLFFRGSQGTAQTQISCALGCSSAGGILPLGEPSACAFWGETGDCGEIRIANAPGFRAIFPCGGKRKKEGLRGRLLRESVRRVRRGKRSGEKEPPGCVLTSSPPAP